MQAINKLPIPKPMRWGSGQTQFIRPVHWVVLLFGKDIVSGNILDTSTGRISYGHRFHDPEGFEIDDPAKYVDLLKEHHVIADFEQRRELILQQTQRKARALNATPVIDDQLLTEVTSITEWPVALQIDFNPNFLTVPKEALISALQVHQKCFALVDEQQQLLAHCITIANIESTDPERVIEGNRKVIEARLSDAAFFFTQDKKQRLSERITELEAIIFQAKLGSLGAKAKRIEQLSSIVANWVGADQKFAARAGLLAKCDLTTDMVGEFPKLQGIMGRYYALSDDENPQVAVAIEEHYQPRFAEDILPQSDLGAIVSISDKVDTLVGLFYINQIPTGEKDPFALRRSALGVLRIIIERKWPIDLSQLIASAFKVLGNAIALEATQVVTQSEVLLRFFWDRLRAWYRERQIRPDVFDAVLACHPSQPHDFDERVHAVNAFLQLPEASALATANKRISNILQQTDLANSEINPALFEAPEEENLAKRITPLAQSLSKEPNYTAMLEKLASLRNDVDAFFDKILVMTDDIPKRNNRLAMLSQLHQLFLNVADISKLQVSTS